MILRLESCRVDLERRVVHGQTGPVALTEQEAELLAYLAARPGQAVPREELQAEVLGYHTGVVSRAVDAALSRLRAKIEVDPAHPAHLHAVRGVGYRFEAVPWRTGTPEPAPPRAPGPPAARLPPEVDTFFGRDEDLRALRRLVAPAGAWCTVLGGPGVGKTRLAVHLAHGLRDEGRAVAFAHLGGGAGGAGGASGAGAIGADALVERVAMALDLSAAGAEPLAERVTRALARRPVLLVLDGVEALAAAGVALTQDWRTAGATVLATSQEPARVAGEQRHPLDAPDAGAALALLLERARAVCPGWGEGAPDALRAIVRRVGRNPLAIELAAGRAAVLSPTDLLAAVERGLAVLSRPGDAGTDLARLIARALEGLDEHDRAALARLSVIDGTFSAADARVVAEVDPDGASSLDWSLDWLQRLVERSLVRRRQLPTGEVAFEVEANVARVAVGALGAAAVTVRARWHAHALARGEALVAALHGAGGEAAVHELRALTDAVLAAHRAWRGVDPGRALAAALVVDAAWEVGGDTRDRLALLDAALGDPGGAPGLRARGYLARAVVRRDRADPEGAASDVDAARALLDPADRRTAGRLALTEAALAEDARDRTVARDRIEEAAALARATADRELEARVELARGRSHLEARDLAGALARFERVHALGREVGSWRLVMIARLRLGLVAREQERPADAARWYRQALELARAVGALDLEAATSSNLAGLHARLGDLARALGHAEAALDAYRRSGTLQSEVSALCTVGALRTVAGDPAGGRAVLDEAHALALLRPDPYELALVEGNLGRCLHALGEAAGALALLRSAAATFARLGHRAEAAWLELCAAAVAGELGSWDGAAVERAATLAGDRAPIGELAGAMRKVIAARAGPSSGRESARTAAREALARLRRPAGRPAIGSPAGALVLPGELERLIGALELLLTSRA